MNTRKFYAMLNGAGLSNQKETLVSSFTQGRTVQLSEMLPKEFDSLLGYLERQPPQKTDPRDQQRKHIIAVFREMGYNTGGRADMPRIKKAVFDKWGKDLNDYDTGELSRIVSVLKNTWLPNYYKQQSKQS